jgi:predicted secreted acid phosphatase
MNYQNKAKIISFFLISFTLISCGSVPVNLQLAKKEVLNYYESGKYSNDLKDIISNAENEINKLNLPANSVVVFDVDETSLSNYEAIKKVHFGYDRDMWDNWINEAHAPPIPEVKQFYDFVVLKKIKVIFLSSRMSSQYNATYSNLINAGYLTFDTLMLKDKSDVSFTSLEFKSKQRGMLTNKGYNIIAVIGDQESDLQGNYHDIQIKLPNYIYIIE